MIHTFYRPDGSEFRARCEVISTPMPSGACPDLGVTVRVSAAAARKFTGTEVWGLGRYAPIKIQISN